ncbi:unnamed protein product [Prorocentrum cordatum]|uniref:Phospholipid scramblase n=1 Tax=Prorocentrum cordatum TaxID=2364126 RepID=A0ABN9PH61_9DINO|nr:unnamed protein product [Polarella glacialis]|mmetsp:Transcript_85590/g.223364  ORF Transcript_85590/g.223364 Transcript_85590/m.223364 type:complete len:245 (+) Transcript_85590:165-899(+)
MAQPAQMGYAYGAPAQQVMAGDLFRGASRVFVKQEDIPVPCCSNEAKQRYRISVPNGDQEGQPFLYITEESDYCTRSCCPVNRGLKLKVHNGPSKDYPVVQTIDKPCSCGPVFTAPCPCCRPQFAAVVRDPLYVVGSIEDPCHCCIKGQRVRDARGAEMFSVSGCINQWGLFCPCCAPVRFDASKGGTTVGGVERKQLPCNDMRDNRFMIDFGSINDPQERRMMFASAMLLDLEFFESMHQATM